jgi:Plavaka transposase
MGYPVIARIGNFPVDIRNGKGLGGGELVGWLPIVGFLTIGYLINQLNTEDEEEKGKKSYVDYKRIVWHEAIGKLLETIAEYSIVGCWTDCGDDIKRQLFPAVIILSSDYEEQYVVLFSI